MSTSWCKGVRIEDCCLIAHLLCSEYKIVAELTTTAIYRGNPGWQHRADLAKDEQAGDTVFEQEGVRIYVDAISLPLVDGTEIDLVKQRLGEQFVFRNPNVADECGCGESFTTTVHDAA